MNETKEKYDIEKVHDEIHRFKQAEKEIMIQRLENIKTFIHNLSISDNIIFMEEAVEKVQEYIKREIL
jgi:hypothetical protein